MAFVPPLPASSLTTVAKASLATPTTFKGAQLRNASLRSQRRAVIRAAAVPMEVDGETFDSEVLAASSDVPVLVDFYASWCGPCKLVSPLMDWAAAEFDGRLKVVKIDTEKHERFVNEYAIHGLPTFAVFRAGEALGVQEGAMGKKDLDEYIRKHAPDL